MINIDYIEAFTGDAIITSKSSHSFKDLVNRIFYYEAILQEFDNKKIAVVGDFNFESISLLLAFRNTNNIFIPIVYSTKDELNKKITESDVDVIFEQYELSLQFNYKFIKK